MSTLIIVLLIAVGIIVLYLVYVTYSFKLLTSRPIYYSIPSDVAIQVRADDTYRSTQLQRYLFDLYLPATSSACAVLLNDLHMVYFLLVANPGIHTTVGAMVGAFAGFSRAPNNQKVRGRS